MAPAAAAAPMATVLRAVPTLIHAQLSLNMLISRLVSYLDKDPPHFEPNVRRPLPPPPALPAPRLAAPLLPPAPPHAPGDLGDQRGGCAPLLPGAFAGRWEPLPVRQAFCAPPLPSSSSPASPRTPRRSTSSRLPSRAPSRCRLQGAVEVLPSVPDFPGLGTPRGRDAPAAQRDDPPGGPRGGVALAQAAPDAGLADGAPPRGEAPAAPSVAAAQYRAALNDFAEDLYLPTAPTGVAAPDEGDLNDSAEDLSLPTAPPDVAAPGRGDDLNDLSQDLALPEAGDPLPEAGPAAGHGALPKVPLADVASLVDGVKRLITEKCQKSHELIVSYSGATDLVLKGVLLRLSELESRVAGGVASAHAAAITSYFVDVRLQAENCGHALTAFLGDSDPDAWRSSYASTAASAPSPTASATASSTPTRASCSPSPRASCSPPPASADAGLPRP